MREEEGRGEENLLSWEVPEAPDYTDYIPAKIPGAEIEGGVFTFRDENSNPVGGVSDSGYIFGFKNISVSESVYTFNLKAAGDVKTKAWVRAKNGVETERVVAKHVSTDTVTAAGGLSAGSISTGGLIKSEEDVRVGLKSLTEVYDKFHHFRRSTVYPPEQMREHRKVIQGFTDAIRGNCGRFSFVLEFLDNERVVSKYFFSFDVFWGISGKPSGHNPQHPLVVKQPVNNSAARIVVKHQWGNLDKTKYTVEVSDKGIVLDTHETRRREDVLRGIQYGHRCTVEFLGNHEW